ncbi:hypothetical protein [Polaribacter sp. Z022]|uniref:hypothetical protein n=1 Tax=Polaribacter sp. Z022 TaxID=2927125 RepID=UPI00201FF76C|nr:hypothetical protein [Polaribacter sp. Z022]MCL7753107.1 hypothetical protein [Polaribacter sp. Z022]
MIQFFPFILIALAIGMKTSDSISNDKVKDVEQIHYSATDTPPSEGAGEEDELEPNN